MGFYTVPDQDGSFQKLWEEERHYEFEPEEIELIANASTELHQMVLGCIGGIIKKGDYERFGLPLGMPQLIEKTWERRDPYVHGRFDLAVMGGNSAPKLIEFNADNPFVLVESATTQREWAEQQPKRVDQFNTIEEDLVDKFRYLKDVYKMQDLALVGKKPRAEYFFCSEDWDTLRFMAKQAQQAGIDTLELDISEVAASGYNFTAYSETGLPLKHMYNTESWENFMWQDAGNFYLPDELIKDNPQTPFSNTMFIEPAWKVLASKAILPLLWQENPGHPNLLESYFADPDLYGDLPDVTPGWVRKPIYSASGDNIILAADNGETDVTDGNHDDSGFIMQKYAPLYRKAGKTALVVSWMVGDKASGIGIRETENLITSFGELFVPHTVV